MIRPWPFLFALVLGTAAYAGQAGSPRATLARAMEDFQAGHVQRSLEGFDRVIALDRAAAPFLWQRGIALYYAGRFRDCQAQFESHRTVNPDDVENAAWHFLCVAKAKDADSGTAMNAATMMPERKPHSVDLLPRSSSSSSAAGRVLLEDMRTTLSWRP